MKTMIMMAIHTKKRAPWDRWGLKPQCRLLRGWGRATLAKLSGGARVGVIRFNDTHHREWRRSVFDDARRDSLFVSPRYTR